MIVRRRLDRNAGTEAIARIESLTLARPILVARLERLRMFLSELPAPATEFPLLATARAVDPDSADPIRSFREFRRTVARVGATLGVDIALVADGRKRATQSARVWWIEGDDAADQKLSNLSEASTTAVLNGPVIPSMGRFERDGKTVVRTYFDVAPADEPNAERCINALNTRLATDREFTFDRVLPAHLGEDADLVRRAALAESDVIVVLLSPEYLRWSTEPARAIGPAMNVARGLVIPVCWSRLIERNDTGPYACVPVLAVGAEGVGPTLLERDHIGLDRLRAGRLDDAMATLHSAIANAVKLPRKEPMEMLARNLAASDEPNPVAARATRALLDKGLTRTPGRGGPAVEVVDHLVAWAMTGDRPYFVVFGEYGMGKTVATQTFTRELLSRRELDPSVPLPIYFDLRLLGTELRKQDAALKAVLADLIQRAWRTGSASPEVTAEDVITAVQQRGAVVIFDGLDEVLVHMSEQQGQGLLRELLRILPPQLATARNTQRDAGKVIFTCRTHFFRTIRDQHTFFRAQDRDGVGPDLYEALHLLPFDDRQVRAYLERKQGSVGVNRALELIRSVHDLAGLAARPYNLKLISEQLERLERRTADGRPIDASALYEELVSSWLERDMGKHQLERDHKLRLMEHLAALLWKRKTRRIGVGELEEWLRERLTNDQDLHRWVQLARPDPAILAEDLRTATFIVRPGTDMFEFAHTSLLEYFLARHLYREMSAGRPQAWALPTISAETMSFLVEVASAYDSGDFDHQLVLCGQHYYRQVSELVVRYAFRVANLGRPTISLRAFRLEGADLRGITAKPGSAIDMTGCFLTGADLRDSKFHATRFDGANVGGALLHRAQFYRCSLRGVNLDGACLDGAILRYVSVHGASMQGVSCRDSQWLWCEGDLLDAGIPRDVIAPCESPVAPSSNMRLEVLAGPEPGIVQAVAWSPDGHFLASISSLRIYISNPNSGLEHAKVHAGKVHALAWSPIGNHLASGGDDGVKLWDPADLDEPPIVISPNEGSIWALAWSPDGSLVACASDDGVIRVWDPTHPDAPLQSLEDRTTERPEATRALAWSPDGDYIASGGLQHGVRLWSPARPEMVPVDGDRLIAQGLAWSPDGAYLASAGNGGALGLWERARPDAPPLRLRAHRDWVRGVAWSPDSTRLASSGGDGEIQFWDPAAPGAPTSTTTGLREKIYSLAWSPDGARVAGGCGDTVRVWDPERPDQSPTALSGHGSEVAAIAWSPDGARLATTDRAVTRVWDLAKLDVVREARTGSGTLAWSPDGSRLASGGRILSLLEDAEMEDREFGRGVWVRAVKWSQHGDRVTGITYGGEVASWDPRRRDVPLLELSTSWLEERKWFSRDVFDAFGDEWRPHRFRGDLADDLADMAGHVLSIAWSPRSPELLMGCTNGVLLLRHSSAGPAVGAVAKGTGPIWAVAWSPDGTRFAAGGRNGAVHLGRSQLTPLGHADDIHALAWSPDGRYLASGSNGELLIFEPDHPELPPRVVPHSGSVRALAWSPDGQHIASGTADGMASVWDARSPVRPQLRIHQFDDGAWCLFGSDGQLHRCSGDVWRWMRWRYREPLTGHSSLLPAEYFGPLPVAEQVLGTSTMFAP